MLLLQRLGPAAAVPLHCNPIQAASVVGNPCSTLHAASLSAKKTNYYLVVQTFSPNVEAGSVAATFSMGALGRGTLLWNAKQAAITSF